MSEDRSRMHTADMDYSSKEALIREKHPVIRELKSMGEIVFDESRVTGKNNLLSLKDLFMKKNMDRYHVDCLTLYRIAENMVRIQKKFMDRHIYPGLYDPGDIFVNMDDSSLPLYIIHPERFQLLDMEQDYEWYPEDERIFGDLVLFDRTSQALADQRLIYKILVASSRGNAKVPPRSSGQDYSSLFYGTLPPAWKEIFEKGTVLTLPEWERELEVAIRLEQSYEREAEGMGTGEDSPGREEDSSVVCSKEDSPVRGKGVKVLFVLLRTELSNSLEMSRMLYEIQDELQLEQEHGKFRLIQGFIYGDGVIRQKEFGEYPAGFRVQIPHEIREYSKVEALLVSCDWMDDELRTSVPDEKETSHRMYILSDGKIENNLMFRICLEKMKELIGKDVRIRLVSGRDSACEGWEDLRKIIAEDQDVQKIKSISPTDHGEIFKAE